MPRLCPGLFLLAAALTSSASMASAADDTSEVVVRGAPSSTVPGFVSKGSEADTPREITDVAGLLEPMPGLHIRRLGPDDTFSTLSIRGSTSSEVTILFAGVPLTGAADPSLDLGSLPLWPGARVKVFRSFTPASIDRGSLGGTLVLEPPLPTDAEGTLSWIGLGSFGEERLRVADVRAIDDGRARLVTALSASRATDDFSYYDSAHSTAASPVYTTRQNAGHASVNGFVAVALPLDLGRGEPGTVTVTTLVDSRFQHLPGSALVPTLFATLATNRELLSVDVAKPTSETSAVHVLGWARRDEAASYDRPATLNSGYADERVSSDDVIVGSGLAVMWHGNPLRRLTVDARVDGSFERFAPGSDVSVLASEPGATRVSAGGGVDVEWRPVARWGLGATGRLDANTDSADALPAGSPAAPPTQGTDVRPTGHVGTEVRVGPVTLAAHGGALARPPSFVERYGGGGVIANPGLEPESALTVDAGGRYVARWGRWHAELLADGFATRASDLITLVPEGALGLLKAENIASARIFGVETSVLVRGHGVDLRAAYTGLVTEDDDSTVCPTCATRPPLPGRPAHDFVGDLAYAIGPVRVRYGVDVVRGLYVDKEGSVLAPDRVLQSTGVRVSVPWVASLRLAFDVRNLFDVRTGLSPGLGGPQVEPVGDQFGYPLPGRSLLFTARWSPGSRIEDDAR